MSIRPRLGFFDLTMIVISLVIGIGIFRTPQIVAQKAGTPEIFFLAWIVGGIVSFCGALTFAEIGSRYPVAGGFYKTFSYCYHPAVAFMLNWVLVVINAGSCAGVALIGAEYINPVLPASLQNQLGIRITVIAVIVILFVLNLLGIKMGARTQNLLSSIKIGMIALFSFSILGSASAQSSGELLPHTATVDTLKAFGISLISVFFTYGGYQQTINFGADVQEPQRNIPRAILAGITIILILYLCINYAYVSVLGFKGVQSSPLLAADLARSFFGEVGSRITSLTIFISVCGFLNVSIMSNPRVYYAMAEDKVLPSIFQKVNDRTQVQEFALCFFVILILVSFFLLGTFEKIVNYVMFIDTISLASLASCIFILRNRAKEGETYTGYRIRWFPLIPVVFILMILIVTANVLFSDPVSSIYGLCILAGGLPLFFLARRIIDRE